MRVRNPVRGRDRYAIIARTNPLGYNRNAAPTSEGLAQTAKSSQRRSQSVKNRRNRPEMNRRSRPRNAELQMNRNRSRIAIRSQSASNRLNRPRNAARNRRNRLNAKISISHNNGIRPKITRNRQTRPRKTNGYKIASNRQTVPETSISVLHDYDGPLTVYANTDFGVPGGRNTQVRVRVHPLNNGNGRKVKGRRGPKRTGANRATPNTLDQPIMPDLPRDRRNRRPAAREPKTYPRNSEPQMPFKNSHRSSRNRPHVRSEPQHSMGSDFLGAVHDPVGNSLPIERRRQYKTSADFRGAVHDPIRNSPPMEPQQHYKAGADFLGAKHNPIRESRPNENQQYGAGPDVHGAALDPNLNSLPTGIQHSGMGSGVLGTVHTPDHQVQPRNHEMFPDRNRRKQRPNQSQYRDVSTRDRSPAAKRRNRIEPGPQMPKRQSTSSENSKRSRNGHKNNRAHNALIETAEFMPTNHEPVVPGFNNNPLKSINIIDSGGQVSTIPRKSVKTIPAPHKAAIFYILNIPPKQKKSIQSNSHASKVASKAADHKPSNPKSATAGVNTEGGPAPLMKAADKVGVQGEALKQMIYEQLRVMAEQLNTTKMHEQNKQKIPNVRKDTNRLNRQSGAKHFPIEQIEIPPKAGAELTISAHNQQIEPLPKSLTESTSSKQPPHNDPLADYFFHIPGQEPIKLRVPQGTKVSRTPKDVGVPKPIIDNQPYKDLTPNSVDPAQNQGHSVKRQKVKNTKQMGKVRATSAAPVTTEEPPEIEPP